MLSGYSLSCHYLAVFNVFQIAPSKINVIYLCAPASTLKCYSGFFFHLEVAVPRSNVYSFYKIHHVSFQISILKSKPATKVTQFLLVPFFTTTYVVIIVNLGPTDSEFIVMIHMFDLAQFLGFVCEP